MSDSTILREYLVRLGFSVNGSQAKKADNALTGLDKKAKGLAVSVIGVGTAMAVMTDQWARNMERLYWASKRIGSSAGNLKALEYGAERAGVSSETMRGAMEGLARNLRANPGLTGLLNKLGVPVRGRDMSDVAVDLVTQLKKMPTYVANQFAALFGMDPDTLFMLSQGLDEMKQATAERKKMAEEMGVDTEKAAEAAHEYANSMREVWERVGLLKDAIAIELLPAMRELSSVAAEVLKSWAGIVRMPREKLIEDLKIGLGIKSPGGGVKLTDEAAARAGAPPTPAAAAKQYSGLVWGLLSSPPSTWQKQIDEAVARGKAMRSGGAAPTASAGGDDGPAPDMTQAQALEMFGELEKQYGLPKGLLAKVYERESQSGKYWGGPRVSPKGAEGPFQLMPKVQTAHGVTDPYNLSEAAIAAAEEWSQHLRASKGDMREATARWNWGSGNLAKYGLGAAPKETRDFMDYMQPAPSINQDVKINIHGVSDPKAAGEAVKDGQKEVGADIVRNMRAKVK